MRISDWSSDVCSSDLMQAPPELVKQIVALPPGEVFILPAGEATLANLVRETRTSPVSENTAQKVALNYLKQKAISQTLKNQLAEIVKKNKDRVRYQSGYGPDRKSTRLNYSNSCVYSMPSSA